jgi:hypothetical protein
MIHVSHVMSFPILLNYFINSKLDGNTHKNNIIWHSWPYDKPKKLFNGYVNLNLYVKYHNTFPGWHKLY